MPAPDVRPHTCMHMCMHTHTQILIIWAHDHRHPFPASAHSSDSSCFVSTTFWVNRPLWITSTRPLWMLCAHMSSIASSSRKLHGRWQCEADATRHAHNRSHCATCPQVQYSLREATLVLALVGSELLLEHPDLQEERGMLPREVKSVQQ